MVEVSVFSKRPMNQLIFISEKLIDYGFEARNLYNNYDQNFKYAETVISLFNVKTTNVDVEFFAKFIDDNDDVLAEFFETKDKSLYSKFVIPEPSEYFVYYDINGTANVTEKFKTKHSCYSDDWVKGSLRELEYNGDWDIYDGTYISDDHYNFESNDYDITDWDKVDSNIKESMLGRLVVENTSEVVNSLDKDTLLKLKNIIDQKLRAL
jgi:hypothetical protein